MRDGGTAVDSITYGIDRIDAHAIPTPAILANNIHLFVMNNTEIRPIPPQINEIMCTPLRLVALDRDGSIKAIRKQTTLYIAKHNPPHSVPCAKSGERSSGAPKTWRATAIPKNCHMQGKANQVKNWTTASCFIVVGISATDEKISAKPLRHPFFSRRIRSNASMFSGGYSFVVATVQTTAMRKTSAPILNE